MDMPIGSVVDRIDAIQARIDALDGSNQGAAPPVAMSGSGGAERPDLPTAAARSAFAQVLQNATQGGAEVDPRGEAVRPLSRQIGQDVSEASAKYGVDPKLIQAVIQVESSGNPQAVSRTGAMGLMQLMPSNVAEAGISDPFDPEQNIDAGARQISALLGEFGGSLDLALAGYNAGPNAVKRYGGIPPYAETQDYVRKIKSIMDRS